MTMRESGTLANGGTPQTAIDTSRPHPARRYDYWLGGKDNFAADRESADRIAKAFPQIRTAAQENRRFLRRAVAFLSAEAGVKQFLDIGAGLPVSPNVHEVTQRIIPASRVVYVDNEPMVVSHARGLMTSSPQGTTTCIQADLRTPDAILADPAVRATIDLTKPVGLLLFAVLHFLDDNENPYDLVARLVDALPSGSYIALSHATLDPLPEDVIKQLTAFIGAGGDQGTFRPRKRVDVARFVDGLDLIDPGVVPIVRWRPDRSPQAVASVVDTAMYGAIARII
ncbi:SAM-dependent methyltransferase [Actinoplanes sp. NPDC049316]|uniref:SAM-dependent methyltransferase n=1 Tax=Actinoplanes sp. NPDC049316 TaxID=3154727 RepID=UPI00341A805E